MLNQDTFQKLEDLVSNGEVIEALNLAVGSTRKSYLLKIRLVVLKSELERKKKSFHSGRISEEEYSIVVNKAAAYLLSLSKYSSTHVKWLVFFGALLIGAASLLLTPLVLNLKSIAVSTPELVENKVSFLFYNSDEGVNKVRFVFKLPEDHPNSLMPTSYVSVAQDGGDLVNLEIIEESALSSDMDAEALLRRMQDIRVNSFEITGLDRGVFQMNFSLKNDASDFNAEEYWEFLRVNCMQSNNMEVDCKRRANFFHKLMRKSVKYFLLIIVIFNLLLLSFYFFFFRVKIS